MAFSRKSRTTAEMMMAAALLLACSMAPWGADAQRNCSAGEPVYPYSSPCSEPAVYASGGEVYEFAAANNLQARLAPTNSSHYVSLARQGAKYELTYLTREIRPYVMQMKDVIFVNVQSGRGLGWRQEGDDYFLMETERSNAIRFQFAKARDVNLPCLLIYPPLRCEAYNILIYLSSSGLSAYSKHGATYFKKSSHGLFPFVLQE